MFGALLGDEAGNQRNRRVLDSVRPDFGVFFQGVCSEHAHTLAVPLRICAGQSHVAVEGQISFDAGVPAFSGPFLDKVGIEILGPAPVGQWKIIVGRQTQPVVPDFCSDAAALVIPGKIVVEESVVTEHQGTGVIVSGFVILTTR